MRSKIIAYGLLFYVLTSAAFFGLGFHHGGKQQRLKDADATQKAKDEIHKIHLEKALELETELAAEQIINRQLSERLRHEIRSPAYDCPVPADGVRILQDAADPNGTGRNAEGG